MCCKTEQQDSSLHKIHPYTMEFAIANSFRIDGASNLPRQISLGEIFHSFQHPYTGFILKQLNLLSQIQLEASNINFM